MALNFTTFAPILLYSILNVRKKFFVISLPSHKEIYGATAACFSCIFSSSESTSCEGASEGVTSSSNSSNSLSSDRFIAGQGCARYDTKVIA